jgi:alginate O-acetyltransferase complex protein AlgJ
MKPGLSLLQKSVCAFFLCLAGVPLIMTLTLAAAYRGVPAYGTGPVSKIWLVKEPVSGLPGFSLQSWMDRSFQDRAAGWFNHTFFLRKPFILLFNQAYYECFGKSYMLGRTIVVGKQGSLYEEYYIRDFCGLTHPLGNDSVRALVGEMREFQSACRRRNVPFVVLITPSKPSVYPEYIPDGFMRAGMKMPRDYDMLVAALREYGVEFVDGRKLTLAAKQANDAPVFCRGSTHWNSLGVLPSVNALVAKIRERGNCMPVSLVVDSVVVDRRPEGTDADLARGLHLLFPPLDYAAPHPVIRAVRGGTSGRSCAGSLAIVGGSFCEMAIDMMEKNGVAGSVDFYYYFRTELRTWPSDRNREASFSVRSIDWGRDFLSKDAVVLEINEAAMHIGHVQMFLREAHEALKRGGTAAAR